MAQDSTERDANRLREALGLLLELPSWHEDEQGRTVCHWCSGLHREGHEAECAYIRALVLVVEDTEAGRICHLCESNVSYFGHVGDCPLGTTRLIASGVR